MNRPHARVISQDIAYDLFPGDLIGRAETAALCINDPHISEAHALVSLRGGALCLLALRGKLRFGGDPIEELPMAAGQVVFLSATQTLRVESVDLPSLTPALQVGGLRLQMVRDRCALLLDPPRLASADHPQAALVLWSTGEGWYARQGDQTQPCEEGTTWRLPGVTARWSLESPQGASRTLMEQGPLRWVIGDERVQLLGVGVEPVVFGGKMAELLTLLALAGRPVQWNKISVQIWTGDIAARRKNYWKQLGDIRARLAAAGLDKELIACQSGLHELRLGPDDRVEDQRSLRP